MNRILLSAATCAAALLSTGAMAAPPEPKPLSAQTRANLEAAMHGEAYANLKYLRYADQAQAAGKPALAKLFRESANIEANEHFDREAQALQLGGKPEVNLEDAMAGEHYENVGVNEFRAIDELDVGSSVSERIAKIGLKAENFDLALSPASGNKLESSARSKDLAAE